MARITEEQIIEINELYASNHNKSLTARTLGISTASVSKYIIDNYVPKAQRIEIPKFSKLPEGSETLRKFVIEQGSLTEIGITAKEWEELAKMRQEEGIY